MNQLAQTALIAAIGGSFHKRRLKAAAENAADLTFDRKRVWAHKAFAADGAEAVANRTHGGKTLFTNWQP
jgi:hypothetical protein